MGSEYEPANGRHKHIETSATTKVSTTTSSAPQNPTRGATIHPTYLRQMYQLYTNR